MNRNKLIVLLLGVALYLISAGASYLFFAKTSAQTIVTSPLPSPATGNNGTSMFDQSLPKTQPCPLNGVLYSTQQEQWWQKHRPLRSYDRK